MFIAYVLISSAVLYWVGKAKGRINLTMVTWGPIAFFTIAHIFNTFFYQFNISILHDLFILECGYVLIITIGHIANMLTIRSKMYLSAVVLHSFFGILLILQV